MNWDEVLQYLDELSDNEDLVVQNQNITEVYTEPPINVNKCNSDVDSDDEKDPSIVSVSGNQFLSPASFVVKGVRKGGIDVEQNHKKKYPEVQFFKLIVKEAKSYKKFWKIKTIRQIKETKIAKENHMNNWQDKNIQNEENFSSWYLPQLVRNLNESPTSMFELFKTLTTFDSSYNKGIGLGGSVIMIPVSKLPKVPDSNYHIVNFTTFFTSPWLLRLLKENGITATGTLRANRTENAPLIAIDEMKKGSRGISDIVNDNQYNVTLVRWNDNKVVTVASTLYGKEPMKKTSRYIKDKGGRVYIVQPNVI
ncbi:unnamed protein product [Lepeophtheirus salmonis]|uniref:(salmon louse) hypothetical protein n=1 Tax=Lepeophtheirus salmonis TaxID=72036 RepID=A0A7R8D1M7_LEPSM|nr:unnamed protein product [Lepeophtheirus salmonis]CAF2997205.1 unnamed protein product [Lepeophtheirus salmonis]